MHHERWALLLLVVPGVVVASDFTPLMILLLVPFGLLALVVWAATWLPTMGLEPWWLRYIIRSAGICFIFTPTYTHGGNGTMFSVSLYDMVISSLGGDPVYAKQAIINVMVATVILSGFSILIGWLDRNRRGKTAAAEGADDNSE